MKRKHEPDATSSQDTSTQVKKQRQDGDSAEKTVRSRFRAGLFDRETLVQYQSSYQDSSPFLHGVIPNLISDSLLRSVRNEIQTHISFTPKETDIYKIHQSGDLANLDGLDAGQLKHLPKLVELRDALYSLDFRNFLEDVTGAGKLSGQKTDMAINVYTPGSYLLCHDDVIGTRRVSYILYLTDPDEPWQAEWGGGLRLYATESRVNSKNEVSKVPMPAHVKVIPPSWGQLSFFSVQPGESFHDVEEVYHAEKVDDEKAESRVRMAISGWYHVPLEGEEGYEKDVEQRLAEGSSLAQLEGQGDEFDEPKARAITFNELDGTREGSKTSSNGDAAEPDDKSALLTVDDFNFLLRFISPAYLTPDMTENLATNFEDQSFIQLDQFLCPKFSGMLRDYLSKHDGLDDSKASEDPKAPEWKIARPPHKHRYLYLQPSGQPPNSPGISSTVPPGALSTSDDPFGQLINALFPSSAFRRWLSLITNLRIDGDATLDLLARRFRKGKDYALASIYSGANPQLEFTLGCTPSTGWTHGEEEVPGADNGATETNPPKQPENETTGPLPTKDRKGKAAETTPQPAPEIQPPNFPIPVPTGPIEFGGEEVYMASDDADVDASSPSDPRPPSDPAIYAAANSDDPSDDAILFTDPPAWNQLSIVLRDRATLRFVKYVSRAARGDRWDVKGVIGAGGEGWGDEEEGEDGDGEEEEEEWEGLGESEASTVGLEASESESEESVY